MVEVMHLSLAHRDHPPEEGRDETAASEKERKPTTGLLLLPSTYLPMEAEELEMHTTRHMRTCYRENISYAIETVTKEDVNVNWCRRLCMNTKGVYALSYIHN